MDANPRLSSLAPHFFPELLRRKNEALARGRDLIDLGAGDPDLAPPAEALRIVSEAASKAGHAKYPPGRGAQALLEAAARWYKRRHGVELDPQGEITVLSGCKEGLGHLPQALLEPGELALVPEPGYSPYRGAAQLAGARVLALPLRAEEGFLPDFEALPKDVAYQAKLVYLNYPNMPTGACATKAFYAKAADWAAKHRVWIAADATYIELADKPHPSFLAAKGAKEVGLEFHSFSKAYSLAGWRIGFAAGSAAAVAALRRVREQYHNGSFGAVQEAAAWALDHSEELVAPVAKAYRARRALFAEGLKASGWEVVEPEGAIYVWAKPPQGGSQAAFEKLADEAAILAVAGPAFGPAGQGWLRFALVAPEERLQEALRRIGRLKWPVRA